MRRFLDGLAGHFDHKVRLVVDGRSAHRSRGVRTWLCYGGHAEAGGFLRGSSRP
ncbi:hypothetical protein [Streptomyces violaceusniger]|uniref:hypothetical protein n=1 Tax=Streptomyces violaceusniger TaxID=68280 RepID=UPI0001E4DA86|nr:hypothetical protein [Streptomyces violaceusniger]